MFKVDTNGDITLVQGDNGQLVLNDLPTDRNYTMYLAIQDTNRKPVGYEVSVQTNNEPSVVFSFLPSLTDTLTVPKGETTQQYTYSVKKCYAEENIEDTLIFGDKSVEDVNTITVYPKRVEGTTNG